MQTNCSQILEAKIDGLHHHFTVALDGEEVELLVKQRLEKVQKTTQIKGFRRGNAPLKVIRSHHGDKITASIVDRLAINVARVLIAEKALQPLGRPVIDILNDVERAQIRFTLTIEVFPKVRLSDVDNFKVERLKVAKEENKPNAELQGLSRNYIKRQIFDQLIEEYEFDVPGEMLNREYERITQTYRENVEDSITPELDMEFHQLAERRIRLAILLTEIGRQHDIHMSREEVEQLVEMQADRDPEHASDVVSFYIEHPTAMTELQSTLFEEKIVDYIIDQATVNEREVTADEMLALCDAE